MAVITIDHSSIYGSWGYSKDFEINIATTALLVVDMQAGMVSLDCDNYLKAYSKALPVDLSYFVERVKKTSTPNVQKLIGFFRDSGMKVVHVWTASETADFSDMPPSKARWLKRLEKMTGIDIYKAWQPDVQIMPVAAPKQGELVVLKKTGSAFNNTGLHFCLQNMGIETLVLVGGNTNGCVFETSVYAGELGYDNILVSDATHSFHPDLQAMAEEIFRVHYGMVWSTEEVMAKLGSQTKRGVRKP